MKNALSRFDRIVSLYIHLLSGRLVRAQDMAERFEVSLRTIYRDIRSLELAGVPVLGEAGQGYSIMEGYRLPPVMFSREEAGSLIAAQKLMQQHADQKLLAHFESALYKLKSVLRGHARERVEALESQVWARSDSQPFESKAPDALEIILESIADKKQADIEYLSFGQEEPTRRLVEPTGLFTEYSYWHLVGYCHLRKEYRQFRTDRILTIRRTNFPFTDDHSDALEQFQERKQCENQLRIIISVEKETAYYLENSRKWYGFEAEQRLGDRVEMSFLCSDNGAALARWYLMFCDSADIIEPQSFQDRVTSLLEKMLIKSRT